MAHGNTSITTFVWWCVQTYGGSQVPETSLRQEKAKDEGTFFIQSKLEIAVNGVKFCKESSSIENGQHNVLYWLPYFEFIPQNSDIVGVTSVQHRSDPVVISPSVEAQMIISSTIFMAHGNTSITTSECLHHLYDDAFKPMGALRYRKHPWGKRGVGMREISSSNPSWN